MNYTHLLSELNQAKAFDLYRLHVAIGNELDNSARIEVIKQSLKVGMTLCYFHHVDNRIRRATLLEVKSKKAVILDEEEQKQFTIPYYMLNLDDAETEIYRDKKTDALTANNLKVGEQVGFNKDGELITGTIKRLNQKTVTLLTHGGNQWRVAYCFLHRIHDGEISVTGLLAQKTNN